MQIEIAILSLIPLFRLSQMQSVVMQTSAPPYTRDLIFQFTQIILALKCRAVAIAMEDPATIQTPRYLLCALPMSPISPSAVLVAEPLIVAPAIGLPTNTPMAPIV